MSRILTKYGERVQLAALFKVSEVTVNSALKGKTKSDLAVRIRAAAIERGGMEEKGNQSPKIESNE